MVSPVLLLAISSPSAVLFMIVLLLVSYVISTALKRWIAYRTVRQLPGDPNAHRLLGHAPKMDDIGTDGVSLKQPSSSNPQEKVICESSNTLGIEDLLQIKKALANVNDWQSLGLELGLLYPTLERIGKGESINKCKTEMIAAWLKQQDNVSKIGVPSWSVLQTALRNIEENEAANQIATV